MKSGAGLDLGRSMVRLAEVRERKGGIVLSQYHAVPLERGERPVDAAAAALGRVRARAARTGVTGADVMLRYLPVPEVEDWRLERLMEFEVRELESKSGSPLATSFNLLPVPKELDDEDTILLGLVREGLLEEWMRALGGLSVEAFTPNAIALYNAFLALGDHEPAVTLLANVGATTLDLALVRGSELYFARSVTTALEKRETTLAERLGTDPARAGRLIHKHLDLKAATEGRLAADAERVTRPLLPLYDTLPTLLSGMVTLCKAQARLRDLALDRVLLTGGGAHARGLDAWLTDRMRVPVSIWNPLEMVDLSALPEDQAEQAEADGPAAAVALGLALSAADPELYAMEILPKASRKKREFKERGVYAVAAGVLAAAFLVADFVTTSGRAEEAAAFASTLDRQVSAREASHGRTEALLEDVRRSDQVLADVEARFGVRRSAEEMLVHLSESLPKTLWVNSFQVQRADGEDWGMPGKVLPVLTVSGRGKDGALPATSVFATFGEELKARLPGGDQAIRYTNKGVGNSFEWTVEAFLVPGAPPAAEEEQ